MFRDVEVNAAFNDVTGYGIHASNFFPELQKLVQKTPNSKGKVTISLLDVVTASQTDTRHPYPSILYNVWESTEYPAEFMRRIRLYDQLWVPSEWQRSWSIAQGIPEEFVKVVPEGVNPDIYKPLTEVPLEGYDSNFNFLLVGKWEPRKSNLEICKAFLAAFPADQYPAVRLYLSCDTMFHCDQYKSTEERLKGYGIEDPRFIIVHFEERADYIRRLQAANVFVSCSRAEGWGLPIIESMACGIPTIVADWSGSTEYARDAILVKVPELKKPEGIYGGWDVPGKWGEPDYDDLTWKMKDAYDNYVAHREKALKTSDYIRKEFSWARAAEKAYAILEELSGTVTETKVVTPTVNVEEDIAAYARRLGYEITGLKKRNAIFTVDCHPDSQPKLDTLLETMRQIKALGYPLLLTSHCPLPTAAVDLADFHIYEKEDILSPPDDMPVYWRRKSQDAPVETTNAKIPCHAAAALANVRNGIDFCLGKYDWIYQMNSDTEIDLEEWLKRVHASAKDLICVRWENQPGTVSGQITAAKTEIMDRITPRVRSWDEFKKIYGEDRFCSEKGYYRIVEERVGLDKVEFLDMELGNRFNQVDTEAWKDDLFQFHFVEGPFLNIVGMSNREYEVSFTNPADGVSYKLTQKPGMWARPKTKFYRDWTIRAVLDGEIKFEHKMDLKDKRVLISLESKALGDTIAWIPYVEEFRKKHGCKVICSGWWMDIFDYPELEFTKPGNRVEDIYASYHVGCYDGQLDRNVKDWRTSPLQQIAADILGVEYKPLRAKLKFEKTKRGNGGEAPKPYVCFSEYSTMRNKFWNREGAWQKVIDYLVAVGYECVSVSTEKSMLQNVTRHNGQMIQSTINDIAGCDFFVGLNAGPTWVAIALGIPAIMITGVSEEWNDFPNEHRIASDVCTPGCFNDPAIPIERGMEWCPRNKNYECTAVITEDRVIEEIEKIRRLKDASNIGETKGDDGNRGARAVEAIRSEQGSPQDVAPAAS